MHQSLGSIRINRYYGLNDQYRVNRKKFRMKRKKEDAEYLKQQKMVYSFNQLMGSLKKAVLGAKMGSVEFENKTITGNKQLENLINKFDGETAIETQLAQWFSLGGSYKGDFKRLSQMFRLFMPKMTQEIMGTIYDFAMGCQRKNNQYKSWIKSSCIDTLIDPPSIYYNESGEDKKRIAPMSEYQYLSFAKKLFRKRYPELANELRPDAPIRAKIDIRTGDGNNSGFIYFRVRDGRIEFSTYGIIEKLKSLKDLVGSDLMKEKYRNLIQKAERIAHENNDQGFI